MFLKYAILFVLFCFANFGADGAKILAVFPFPGPSQYISVQPYLRALSDKGHNLTVISHFPQKEKLSNFRDIVLEYVWNEEMIKNSMESKETEVVWSTTFFTNATISVLENKEVKELMQSGEKFDLIIIETLLIDALYAFGPHFNAHLIGFSTYGTDSVIDNLVGNTSPLSYIPPITSSFSNHMTFRQRLQTILQAAFTVYYLNQHFGEQKEIYRKHFPHLPYELENIRKNFSLILLNQHFSLSFPRPYVPNMIEVGGLYIHQKPQPLPKYIDDFINGAEHGVIYFSMGSNVKSKYFTEEKKAAVLKVLGSLKQRVLWKFEDPDLLGKPDNVFISKWFPQTDILAHPKVKLFITHGGLLSTTEAIYHGKPILGIPVFFDQFMNIERSRKNGYGLSVPYRSLNEHALRIAISRIIDNQTFVEAIKRVSKIYHDQPIKPLDNAIFWTEYVLRHDGARHMRVAARHLSFVQYYSLDTIGCIVAVVVLFLWIVFKILKLVLTIIRSLVRPENKKKEE